MKIYIKDIVTALIRYRDRYQWLNVFASEVQELAEHPSPLAFVKKSDDTYEILHDGQAVEMVISPRVNLAQFRLLQKPSSLAENRKDTLDYCVLLCEHRRKSHDKPLGLLMGGFTGRQVEGSQEPEIDENRILPLCFDAEGENWKAYHGSYLGYAKAALHPNLAEE